MEPHAHFGHVAAADVLQSTIRGPATLSFTAAAAYSHHSHTLHTTMLRALLLIGCYAALQPVKLPDGFKAPEPKPLQIGDSEIPDLLSGAAALADAAGDRARSSSAGGRVLRRSAASSSSGPSPAPTSTH